MTHDIDVVVDVSLKDVAHLVETLDAPDLYLDADAAAEAVRSGGSFNLIDASTGGKVDFWLLTDDAFDLERFKRRGTAEFADLRFAISTPEDTILMKLRWAAQSGGSEKQIGDAIGVYEVQAGVLDECYLDDWAARLGVQDLLARVRSEAEPVGL